MRISSITATDLLSFAQLDLAVADGLSVIVGPNGSGKTNLGRVVRLATAAAQAAASGDFTPLNEQWSLAGRYGSSNFEVRLGLEFDQEHERSIIEDWARAALLSAFQFPNAEVVTKLDRILPKDLAAGSLLAYGQLVVRRDNRRSSLWTLCWQTRHPIGSLALWSTYALMAGQPTDEMLWPSSRARLQDLLRDVDGNPLPDLSNPAQSPNWEEDYSLALAAFGYGDLLTAPAPVELVARLTNTEQEIPAIRRLKECFPRLGGSRGHLNFVEVLDYLISSALTVTDNRRIPMRTSVTPTRINTRSDLADGSNLAVELLRLKTGDAASRTRFRAAQEVFTQITGRHLDVRQHATGTETEELIITPVVVDTDPGTGLHVDLALQQSGAGVEESAWLAVLLTDDRDTLILDEPASNVSAVAQRRLLQVVRERRRNHQTIMITHSADLVPVTDASDLAVVMRLDHRHGSTTVHKPQLGPAEFDSLKELLRQSQLRALLFAAGVVLVEGNTEVDAFETWLAKLADSGLPTPEASHVVFLSVGGDERFPKYAQLMDILGISWAIIADGPAFAPSGALSKLPKPVKEATDTTDRAFKQAVRRWQTRGVRTLAKEFGIDARKGRGEIEVFFETVDLRLWQELSQGAGRKDKPLLGYRFASRTPIPTAVIELWQLLRHDLGLTHRLDTEVQCDLCEQQARLRRKPRSTTRTKPVPSTRKDSTGAELDPMPLTSTARRGHKLLTRSE